MKNIITTPIGHTSIENRKVTGSHYTPKILSDFVADEILKYWKRDGNTVRIMDPALGDGELLNSIIQKLDIQSNLTIEVQGFDTDHSAIDYSQKRLTESSKNITVDLKVQDFLEYATSQYATNLFTTTKNPPADLIIANPPYVRNQVLGAIKSKELANEFGLNGRIDLYHAFMYCIARIIKPGGILGIIVSNRFMTTKSGESIRKDIIDNFDVLHIWDLGDTQLFEAAVLPAVLILKRKNQEMENIMNKFSSIYIYKNYDVSDLPVTEHAITALSHDGIIKTKKDVFMVKHGNLDFGNNSKGVWRISNEDSDQWIQTVKENTYLTFRDIDKIRVGVKTTADKVFIRSDWHDFPFEKLPELLKPLATHHIARRFKSLENVNKKILYTHEIVNGKKQTIDIDKYPNSYDYLRNHKNILEAREYIKQAKRKWYEIWVPQDPDLWQYPKMVFRDISEKPTFWLDVSGSIINGDCYWIVVKDKTKMDLLWLALAIANSSFIESYYDRMFNNKLYSGRRRFITQYVEKFPIPDPNTELSKLIIKKTKEIYSLLPQQDTSSKEQELDKLVWKVFCVNQ